MELGHCLLSSAGAKRFLIGTASPPNGSGTLARDKGGSNVRKQEIALALALAVTLVWPGGAALAGWIQLGEDETSVVYADRDTIVRRGGMATMMSLLNYKSFQRMVEVGYFSQKLKAEYDCQAKKRRDLARVLHAEPMGAGKVIYEDDTPHDWEEIEAGSRSELLLKIACR